MIMTEQERADAVRKGTKIYESCIAEVPFDPLVAAFRLSIGGSELAVLENREDRLSTVITALAGYYDQIGDDRMLISEFPRPMSQEEFLMYLSDEGNNRQMILSYLLVGELKTRLEEIIGKTKISSVARWGCLRVEFIE